MARMRFWENIEKTTTCWLWTGRLTKHGYGKTNAQGQTLAHRLAYQLLVGPIPENKTLDHLCRVRRCVNPGHLEPVSAAENTRRGFGIAVYHSRLARCINGHPFDASNTRASATARGVTRVCRACERARQASHRARKGLAA